MDPQIDELKQLVRENTELTKETNKIVAKLQRAARWARAMKIVWIALIILIGFGAYVYFQPFIEQMMELYATATEALQQAKEFGSQFTGGGE